MIYVISGEIGSGKSLKVLPWMRDAAEAGRPVFTNIQLTERCPFVDKVALIGTEEWPVAYEDDEWAMARRKLGRPVPQFFWEYVPEGSLVVIDEADIYFDSSDYGEMKKQTKIYHKQLRKFGHDVVYIVQRISNLYKRIRDLASRYYLAEHNYRTIRIFAYIESMFGKQVALNMSRFFYWEFIDPSFAPHSQRGLGEYTYKEASEFFGWYDTKQLLGDTRRLIGGKWREQNGGDAESGDVVKAAGRTRRRNGARRFGSNTLAEAAREVGLSVADSDNLIRGLRDVEPFDNGAG